MVDDQRRWCVVGGGERTWEYFPVASNDCRAQSTLSHERWPVGRREHADINCRYTDEHHWKVRDEGLRTKYKKASLGRADASTTCWTVVMCTRDHGLGRREDERTYRTNHPPLWDRRGRDEVCRGRISVVQHHRQVHCDPLEMLGHLERRNHLDWKDLGELLVWKDLIPVTWVLQPNLSCQQTHESLEHEWCPPLLLDVHPKLLRNLRSREYRYSDNVRERLTESPRLVETRGTDRLDHLVPIRVVHWLLLRLCFPPCLDLFRIRS
jgi:hypothetical protein